MEIQDDYFLVKKAPVCFKLNAQEAKKLLDLVEKSPAKLKKIAEDITARKQAITLTLSVPEYIAVQDALKEMRLDKSNDVVKRHGYLTYKIRDMLKEMPEVSGVTYLCGMEWVNLKKGSPVELMEYLKEKECLS